MQRRWAIFVGISLALHAVFAVVMLNVDPPPPPPKQTSVKIKVAAKEPEPPKPVPKKVPPKPPKPKKPEKKVLSERKPEKKPVKDAQPVQGVSERSLTDGPANVSVPVGNTLMVEDKGIRLSADQVDALEQDLSRDAVLIAASVIRPEYTDEALDAGIEGIFRVEVYVDETGGVVDATLEEKIGYGMDRRVLQAVSRARFEPRRDKTGKAIPGWTVIKFSLKID